MGDRDVLTEAQWEQIAAVLPPVKGVMGRPCVPHRPVVEGIIYRYRAGIPWVSIHGLTLERLCLTP